MANSKDIVETRKIDLRDEGVLEVEMTQKFIDLMKQHFGLLENERIDDKHVISYIFKHSNAAIEKAELGIYEGSTEAPKRLEQLRKKFENETNFTIHICTHSYNDPMMLPTWLLHHSSEAPNAKIHAIVTEHNDGEIEKLQNQFPKVDFIRWQPKSKGKDRMIVKRVEKLQDELFDAGARVFVHLDVDEFLLTNEEIALGVWLDEFEKEGPNVSRPCGWQVFHQPRTELSAFYGSPDLLEDRNVCYQSGAYSKPCIVKSKTQWTNGFHKRIVDGKKAKDNCMPSIDLVHMHWFDLNILKQKQAWRNTKGSGLRKEWHYASQMDDAAWYKFFDDLVPPWDPKHAVFKEMRKFGKHKINPRWRGRLINPNFDDESI